MRRWLPLLSLLVLAGSGKGEDSIPLDTLQAIKKATVFIKVDAGSQSGSGSGFVIRVEGTSALIVTNRHVAVPTIKVSSIPRRSGPTPPPVEVRVSNATLTAVFSSGTREERAARAELLAADEEKDLAVLRVSGVVGLPRPIPYQETVKLVETMPVWVFGFPFGSILAMGKRGPAITIGKGSISSIRLDDNGELAMVQIDGALNPGNSGGPVVDAKGRLVGVAVATIRGSSGIGLAIPAQELSRLLLGRVASLPLLQISRRDPGAIHAHVEMQLLDPLRRLRAVTLYYAAGSMAGTQRGPVSSWPGARKARLEIRDQRAIGEIVLPLRVEANGLFTFQAEYVNGAGKSHLTEARMGRVRGSDNQLARPTPTPEPESGTAAGRPPATPSMPEATTSTAEVDQLARDLRSPQEGRRQIACMRLSRATPSGDRKAVIEALKPLLSERNAHTRLLALKAHVVWAGKEGVEQYYDLLTDEEPAVRQVVIEALGKLEGGRAAEAIASRLTVMVDRRAALQALRDIGRPAEKAVLPFLGNRDWSTRVIACHILADIGSPASVPALVQAAEGIEAPWDANVRRAANEAIAAIKAR